MKPILFNTEMVRAILDGRKTQTRRVCKITVNGNQPVDHRRCESLVYPERNHEGICANFYGGSGLYKGASKPQYQPGDILYVRETWNYCGLKKADWTPDQAVIAWRPSIHMPKTEARLFLRVTDVRAERLQESFNAPTTPILAVQAEGIYIGDTCRECIFSYGMPCCVDALDDDGSTLGECGMLDENRGEFSDLWDSTIKPADRQRYGWAANPWVWVIEFERLEKPEEE